MANIPKHVWERRSWGAQAQLAQQQQAFHDLLEVKAALDRRSEGAVPNGATKPATTASPAKATEVDALRAAAAHHADERQSQAERIAALEAERQRLHAELEAGRATADEDALKLRTELGAARSTAAESQQRAAAQAERLASKEAELAALREVLVLLLAMRLVRVSC